MSAVYKMLRNWSGSKLKDSEVWISAKQKASATESGTFCHRSLCCTQVQYWHPLQQTDWIPWGGFKRVIFLHAPLSLYLCMLSSLEPRWSMSLISVSDYMSVFSPTPSHAHSVASSSISSGLTFSSIFSHDTCTRHLLIRLVSWPLSWATITVITLKETKETRFTWKFWS